MNCPKCGTKNPDDAQVCTSCGSEFKQPTAPAEAIKVTTSRIAIASLVLAILSICAFFSAVILNSDILVFFYLGLVISALVLGIISLAQVGLSAGRIAGLGFTITGVIIAIIPSFFIFAHSILYRPRCVAFPMVCGSNLSGIGRAMLIYANDYDNELPRVGRKDTIWRTKINNWRADNKFDAFVLRPDGTGGAATISSSLYLLVKYAEITPIRFVCKGNPETTEFKPAKYGVRDKEPEDLWDFGPEPTKHCSYSYHMPYGPYCLSTAYSDPNQAVAADRNPWLDPYTDTTGFKWDDYTKTGGREDIYRYQKGNCGHHQREGQNVLFMDNHVFFEKQPFCGVNDDNIYTYWNGSDIRQGVPPVIGSQPKGPLDSLLVNEIPLDNSK
jgi:hypothetical protein